MHTCTCVHLKARDFRQVWTATPPFFYPTVKATAFTICRAEICCGLHHTALFYSKYSPLLNTALTVWSSKYSLILLSQVWGCDHELTNCLMQIVLIWSKFLQLHLKHKYVLVPLLLYNSKQNIFGLRSKPKHLHMMSLLGFKWPNWHFPHLLCISLDPMIAELIKKKNIWPRNKVSRRIRRLLFL